MHPKRGREMNDKSKMNLRDEKFLEEREVAIRKIAVDLSEPMNKGDIKHQIKKLNQEADEIKRYLKVHGNGTGNE